MVLHKRMDLSNWVAKEGNRENDQRRGAYLFPFGNLFFLAVMELQP